MTNPNPLTPEELAAIRERFEAWYATPENGATLHDKHQFRRYPEDNPELPGEYTNWEVDLAWRAWQAALEAGAWRPMPDSARSIIEHHLEQIESQCAEADACGHDDFAECAAAAAKWLRDIIPPSPPKDTQ